MNMQHESDNEQTTQVANPSSAPEAHRERSLRDQILDLLQSGGGEQLELLLESVTPGELARAISMLDDEERGQLLDLVDAEAGADLLELLPYVQAVQLLEEAKPDQAAAAIGELPSDLQADLLTELDDDDAEAILSKMEPEEASAARDLQRYAEYSAGGLMVTELLKYPEEWTIAQVVADLQSHADEYRDYQIQYAYVCDDGGRLRGVLRLRDLLLGSKSTVISKVMLPNPMSVQAEMTLEALHGFFQQHHFLGVPVVNAESVLLGVAQRADVDEAWIELQDKSFLRRQGIVSGEEIRSLPLWERSKGRLVRATSPHRRW